MQDKKIRVALVYKKSYNFFQPDHFDRTSYDLFFKALKRNRQLEISYYPCEKKFDVSKIKGKCDIILLPNNRIVDYGDGSTDGAPDALIGIKNSNIPVISRTGDPHVAKKYNQIELHEKFKIDCYWSLQPKSYFYKFYPKHFLYKEILWGLEPSLYKNLKSYKSRIKNKILNSGNVGRNDLKSKFGHIFSKDINSALYFYKLRTMCNKLPYVDYAGMKENKWGRVLTVVSSSVRQPVDNLELSNSLRPGIVGLFKSLAVTSRFAGLPRRRASFCWPKFQTIAPLSISSSMVQRVGRTERSRSEPRIRSRPLRPTSRIRLPHPLKFLPYIIAA